MAYSYVLYIFNIHMLTLMNVPVKFYYDLDIPSKNLKQFIILYILQQ